MQAKSAELNRQPPMGISDYVHQKLIFLLRPGTKVMAIRSLSERKVGDLAGGINLNQFISTLESALRRRGTKKG